MVRKTPIASVLPPVQTLGQRGGFLNPNPSSQETGLQLDSGLYNLGFLCEISLGKPIVKSRRARLRSDKLWGQP